jgi:hypothetical protein
MGHFFKLGIIGSPTGGRYHIETQIASHILCECLALAELTFFPLGKHFMEPSNYDKILPCKILYSGRDIEILAE